MTRLLRWMCGNGATVMLDMFQWSLSWSLLLLGLYPLNKGPGSSLLSEMQLALLSKGVPAGGKGDCLDAAVGADVGACDFCVSSDVGGDTFIKVAFCKVFAR